MSFALHGTVEVPPHALTLCVNTACPAAYAPMDACYAECGNTCGNSSTESTLACVVGSCCATSHLAHSTLWADYILCQGQIL